MSLDEYYDTSFLRKDYTRHDGAKVWDFIHNWIGFHNEKMEKDEYEVDNWKMDFNKVMCGLHSMVLRGGVTEVHCVKLIDDIVTSVKIKLEKMI